MFRVLRLPTARFRKLPRSVKTACLFLPPAASHLLYSLSNQPLFDNSLDEVDPHTVFLKEDSLLKVWLQEVTCNKNLQKFLIESREEAIRKREKREICVLSVPEPDASSVLLKGLQRASGSPVVIQKRGYQTVRSDKRNPVVEEKEMFVVAKKVLHNLSCVSEKVVARTLKRSEELQRLVVKSPDLVAERFEWLLNENFSRQEIVKFGGLLTVKPDQLEQRLDVVKRKFEDFSTLRVTAGILGVDINSLDMYMRRWKSEAETYNMKSRVHWFSDKLEVSCQDVMDQMDTKPMLMTYSFEVVRKKLLLLLEAGLQPKDLYDDLWIVARLEDTLRERLKILQESGITNIKPWHLRCSVGNFNRCTSLGTAAASAKALYPDLRSYFKDKLQIDDKHVEYMFTAAPQLMQHSQWEKTDETLNFLLQEGFSKEQIVTGPKVLTVSADKVKERLERIREFGFDVKDVPKSYFFVDKFHFESALERLQMAVCNPRVKIRKSRNRFKSVDSDTETACRHLVA